MMPLTPPARDPNLLSCGSKPGKQLDQETAGRPHSPEPSVLGLAQVLHPRPISTTPGDWLSRAHWLDSKRPLQHPLQLEWS